MRSDNRKKSKRPKIYASKFVGITPDCLDSFRQMPSDDREDSFYLLVAMLLAGTWNFHDPDGAFYCTQRSIRDSMGWGYGRIRRYRQVLTDAKLLTIKQDGSGRYGNALTYVIDCGKLGIKRRRDRSKRKKNRI